jgi:hypothetical protein
MNRSDCQNRAILRTPDFKFSESSQKMKCLHNWLCHRKDTEEWTGGLNVISFPGIKMLLLIEKENRGPLISEWFGCNWLQCP